MNVGIDEVGRGALAGPVYVCAFGTKLSEESLIELFCDKKLRDSKKLSATGREKMFEKLSLLRKKGKVLWSIGTSSAKEIDTYGITKAIESAVVAATFGMKRTWKIHLDGGLRAPKRFTKQMTIIRGDEHVAVIACASIVAKVSRDKYMRTLAKKYKGYGLEHHVGYGTKKHQEALHTLGKTSEHRSSFLKKIFEEKP